MQEDTTTLSMRAFDVLTAPLEPGLMLVEASAGTGKTWSITGLVVRLVVDHGMPLDRLLVVTFTRAATAELRERVRARLGEAEAAIEAGPVGPEVERIERDPVLRWVRERAFAGASSGTAGRSADAQVVKRIRAARLRIDSAQITTIHGFCQRMLEWHAFESGQEFEVGLVDDVQALRKEMVNDLLSTLHAAHKGAGRSLLEAVGLDAGTLAHLIAQAVERPDARPAHAEASLVREPREVLATWGDAWRAAVVSQGAALPAELFAKKGRSLEHLPTMGDLAKLGNNLGTTVDDFIERGERALAQLRGGHAAESLFGPDTLSLVRMLHLVDVSTLKSGVAAQAAEIVKDWPRVDAFRDDLFASIIGWARRELRRRLDARGEMTQSDLVHRLADALRAEAGAAQRPLREGIRGRFDAALIDEFQDTDEAQWTIFRTVFGTDAADETPRHPLVLIGDPKQAIYEFRGGNIDVYGEARAAVPPERRFTMAVNYRSDGRVIDALNGLWGLPYASRSIAPGAVAWPPASEAEGFFLRGKELPYVMVRDRAGDAGGPSQTMQLRHDARPAPPIRLRIVRQDKVATASNNDAQKSARRRALADDVARLLDGGWKIDDRDVTPSDIGVLVEANADAATLQALLRERGVPATVPSRERVTRSEAATALIALLAATLDPARTELLHMALAGPLVHVPIPTLQGMLDDQEELRLRWVDRVKGWNRTWASRGLVAMLMEVLASTWAPDADETKDPEGALSIRARLLRRANGPRVLTDLLHLGELAEATARAERFGPVATLAWLTMEKSAVNDGNASEDERTLRLESDDKAVTIVTTHASKGLEYPIVFVLDAGTRAPKGGSDPQVAVVPSEERPSARQITWSNKKVDADASRSQRLIDERTRLDAEEARRKLYVALTRAKHHVFLYFGTWTDGKDKRVPAGPKLYSHPASRQLLVPALCDAMRASGRGVPNEGHLADAVVTMIEALGLTEHIECSFVDPGPMATWTRPRAAEATAFPPLVPVESGPWVSASWRRASFSAMKRLAHDAAHEAADGALGAGAGTALNTDAVGAPDAARDHDIDAGEAVAALEEAVGAALPPVQGVERLFVPFVGARSGRNFGSFLHEVLERVPFAAAVEAEGRATLDAAIRDRAQRHGILLPGADADTLAEELIRALRAPLGAHAPGGGVGGAFRLCDVDERRRLDELEFLLPLRGGLTWRARVHGMASRALAEADDAERDALVVLPERIVKVFHDAPRPAAGSLARPGVWERWLHTVGTLQFAGLAGFLTGFIDLVVATEVDGRLRWFLLDYKTNRLSTPPGGLSEGDASQAAVADAMVHHLYILQYHLYLVALRRYLRLRVADFDWERDFGGVWYPFLRAMDDTRPPGPDGLAFGVFFDRPAEALIEALDHALADAATLPEAAE